MWEPVTAADLVMGDVVRRSKHSVTLGMITLVEDVQVGPRARREPGFRFWFGDHGPVEKMESKRDARWYRYRRSS